MGHKIFVIITVFSIVFIKLIEGNCLNNFHYKFTNEWFEDGVWQSVGTITPKINGRLKNWVLKITFKAPLSTDITTWVTRGIKNTAGKTHVELTYRPDHWNSRITKDTNFVYNAHFNRKQGRKHYTCIEFCGTVVETGKKLCPETATPAITYTPKPTPQACLNNFHYNFINEWFENGVWQSEGTITPKINGRLKNWVLKITFKAPLSKDITTWVTRGIKNTAGKTHVELTYRPDHWNSRITKDTNFAYHVYFNKKQGKKHYTCIEFCGTVVETGRKLCSGNPFTTQATTDTSKKRTEVTSQYTTPVSTDVLKATTKVTPQYTTPVSTDSTIEPTVQKVNTTAQPIYTTTTSQPCVPKYNYTDALYKSLLFYEAQRSGKLPSTQRVKWRKDSALQDGRDVGVNLTGGYYDAGDYVKFGFPMASAMTLIAWGLIEYKESYKTAEQLQYALETLKFGTDYFVKCHTAKFEFYAQVGDAVLDHAFWGRPEFMTMRRPSFKIDSKNPGTEVAAETASALAASSMVFKTTGDTEYANILLKHAEELYEFADKYRKMYHVSIPQAAAYYKSHNGYDDELAWGRLWLYKATGKKIYYKEFLEKYQTKALNEEITEFSWDNKWAGVKVLAAQISNEKNFLQKFKNLLQQPKATPKGLFFVQRWGANRHAANLAFLALIASAVEDTDFYTTFARQQIHYMLGDTGRSYLIGFGKNYPLRPHHASSSCPDNGPCGWDNFLSSKPNAHLLVGALVGGPDEYDVYEDLRQDYVKNEVTCDYNSGFQSALAGLLQYSKQGKC